MLGDLSDGNCGRSCSQPSFDATVFCVVGSRLIRKESPAPCALLRHVASFPFGLVVAPVVVTVVVGPI